MPYIKRWMQLNNTLLTFTRLYKHRNDAELIIIEDSKNLEYKADHKALLNLINTYKDDLTIVYDVFGDRGWTNPAPLFNRAAQLANGEFFIITSPEVMHDANILDEIGKEFAKNPDVYVVCSCESIRNGHHHTWYQHSLFPVNRGTPANRMYHFCTAISRDNYFKIGGFDEGYASGISYDDNDFIHKIKNAKLPIRVRDDLKTIHQEHPKDSRPRGFKALVNKNRLLFEKKWNVNA